MSDILTDNFTEWSATLDEYGVATIELTHEKSALNDVGLVELRDILETLVNRTDVEVIVISGGTAAFCLGLDIRTFAEIVEETGTDSSERRRQIREYIRLFHASIVEIREARQPVIAAVDGMAAGGGFSLALASDLILASLNAAFTHAYTDLGVTSDGGSTYTLPRLVGLQKAKELVFASQPVAAPEMADLGVVNEVIDEDFEATVDERARELADRPSEAIAHTKRLLNEGVESTMETQLQRERRAFTEVTGTDTFERRVEEFLNSQ